jgi:myosin protein heavy chain
MQQDEVSQTTSSAAQAGNRLLFHSLETFLRVFIELKAAVQALQANEHTLQGRYESAEIERAKAVSSEQQGESYVIQQTLPV